MTWPDLGFGCGQLGLAAESPMDRETARPALRERLLALVALGELFEVQQLPSGHDEVADGQAGSGPAGGPHGDLEQQTRCVVRLGHEDVGHEGAHDGGRQLLPGVDRDDPAQLTPMRRW